MTARENGIPASGKAGEAPRKYSSVGWLLVLVTAPLQWMVWGTCAAALWRWFVVPTFTAAPSISAPYFVGISMLAALLRRPATTRSRDGWDALSQSFDANVFFPLVLLLFAWLIKIWWIQ